MLPLINVYFVVRRRCLLWIPRRGIARAEGNGLGEHPTYCPGCFSCDGWQLRQLRTRDVFSVIPDGTVA